MAYRRLSSQTILGALVVLIGLALLLDTTGVYDTGGILRYTPLLFVALGVYAIVTSRFDNLFGPIVVILVAVLVQAAILDLLVVDSVVRYWPVLVVLFGLSVLLGRLRSRAAETSGSYLDAFALFGGVNRRATSAAFVGATLTAVFGGTELDLRGATLGERPARISATALFGGVEVIVPRDWNVELDVLPIFGAAEDERPRREGEHDTTDLVVTGFAAFGGVGVTD